MNGIRNTRGQNEKIELWRGSSELDKNILWLTWNSWRSVNLASSLHQCDMKLTFAGIHEEQLRFVWKSRNSLSLADSRTSYLLRLLWCCSWDRARSWGWCHGWIASRWSLRIQIVLEQTEILGWRFKLLQAFKSNLLPKGNVCPCVPKRIP